MQNNKGNLRDLFNLTRKKYLHIFANNATLQSNINIVIDRKYRRVYKNMFIILIFFSSAKKVTVIQCYLI